ncbi:phytoene/squalene synthase family protein [Myceligenerans indicum]|uniref:Squalene/phytoene synthase family protein n=1 Tax=Myceligenerans indicum TaxID=2593663 RepID=A0ABS1LLQ1_9MICO|nr:squalene/phytoene synthase family protein [Myceligenerans indicum]MBL0887093.1 squalene/phytoene synthase family protein [Myceligenerans indicum]
MSPSSSLALYSETAHTAAAHVISAYSTSFGLAARLLPSGVRAMIQDIYALVRVADEIVDGPAHEAGLAPATCRATLDALEAQTLAAVGSGFSANIVVHAFARTARTVGIDESLVAPFFASMRRDLDPVTALSEEEYRTYVHGSAEVVGLMCLRAFLYEDPAPAGVRRRLEDGARRLGAAFQKVNFLRDLGDDERRLGRAYFPGTGPKPLDDDARTRIVGEIDADLAAARAVIPLLPAGPRRATAVAAALFGELNDRLRDASVEELRTRRVSVPTAVKIRVVATALSTARSGRRWAP